MGWRKRLPRRQRLSKNAAGSRTKLGTASALIVSVVPSQSCGLNSQEFKACFGQDRMQGKSSTLAPRREQDAVSTRPYGTRIRGRGCCPRVSLRCTLGYPHVLPPGEPRSTLTVLRVGRPNRSQEDHSSDCRDKVLPYQLRYHFDLLVARAVRDVERAQDHRLALRQRRHAFQHGLPNHGILRPEARLFFRQTRLLHF